MLKRFNKGVLVGLGMSLIFVALLVLGYGIWKRMRPVQQIEIKSKIQGVTSEIRINVEGIASDANAKTIEEQIKKLPGVISVEVKRAEKFVLFQYDPEKISPVELQQAVQKLGYKAKLQSSTGGLKVIDYSIQFNR